MPNRNVRMRLLEAAKALESAVNAMGPSPINPVFSDKINCRPIEASRDPFTLSPSFAQNPPCRAFVSASASKGGFTNPIFGQNPPCKPIPTPWVRGLQTTLLETAAWLRYLATVPEKPAAKAPRKRPKAKPRPKRATRRVR